MILLALVFLCFGLLAEAYVPAVEPADAGLAGFEAGQITFALPTTLIPGN